MSEIISKEIVSDFLFESHNIKVFIDSNQEIWFIAKEIANILGYARTNKMLERIDIEDKKTIPRNSASFIPIEFFRNQGSLAIINESGLYNAIFGSKMPVAKSFKRWVTSEVLPQIRKTGSYKPQPTKPSLKQETENIILASQQYQALEKVFQKFGNLSQKELAEKTSNSVFQHTGIDFLKMYGGFPKEAKHSFKNTFSLTSLLEKHNIQIQTSKFNLKLEKLEIVKRYGKSWKILDLQFGKNEIYQNDTNPKYFEESFEDLLKLVFP